MANIFEIPLVCPLKPLIQSDKLPSAGASDILTAPNPSFNTIDWDADFMSRTFRTFENKRKYFQPFQQSDVITVCWLGSVSTLASYQYARLLDEVGNVFTLKTVTVATDATSYGGMYLYWVNIDLWDVPEGKYYLQLRCLTASGYGMIIFEPFHVKQTHFNTVAIDYYNSRNTQGIIYPTSGFSKMRIRVKGAVQKFEPKAKMYGYENQTMNYEVLSGLQYREYTALFRDVPQWMADKINRIQLMNHVSYDGKELARPQDGDLKSSGNDSPVNDYTIMLREQTATDTIDLDVTKIIQVGVLPQTRAFWVERIIIDGVTVNIRRGFMGKRNFLDYLNANKTTGVTSGATWAEDAKGNLITIGTVTVCTLEAAYVLNYGFNMKCDKGNLSINIKKGAIGGTVYYAVEYGDGGSTTNRTAYVGTQAITRTYTTDGSKDCWVYTNDCAWIEDNGSTCRIYAIGGDLPPTMGVVTFSTATYTKISTITNNMFEFVTANTFGYFNLANQNLDQYTKDNFIRWAYEQRTKFTALCEIYLNTQSPSTTPSNDQQLLNMASIVAKAIAYYLYN